MSENINLIVCLYCNELFDYMFEGYKHVHCVNYVNYIKTQSSPKTQDNIKDGDTGLISPYKEIPDKE